MSSPFDWMGKPSVFTTGRDHANFTGANHERALRSATREKLSPVELEGSSPHLPIATMRSPHRQKLALVSKK